MISLDEAILNSKKVIINPKFLEEELFAVKKLNLENFFLSRLNSNKKYSNIKNSHIAYILDLTDEIKNEPTKLYVDRGRIDAADIDIDFEDNRRDEMKDYMGDEYGETLSISTFTTLKSKSLIRSIARVLSIPLSEVDAVCKQFDELDEYETAEGTKSFRASHPEIYPLAKRLEGHISASGVHAAGLVIANQPMEFITPIESRTNPQDKKTRVSVTAFDMDDSSSIGLIKFDFLGLKTLTIIHDTLNLIKARHNLDIDWENLDVEDKKVLKLFNDGHTCGIFQAEASAFTRLLLAIGVDSFNDIVASNALVRPGAFNTVADTYIKRKKGLEPVDYPHEDVVEDLKDTFACYIFQEQIMIMAVKLGGFTWTESDQLRKIMGKKKAVEEWLPWKEKWITNAGSKLGKQKAEKIWKDFEYFSGYGFNKSHAVAYSYLGFVTAYLKYYYPLEYMYGLLKNEGDGSAKMTYLLEAKRLGIQLLPPDVNSSQADISIDGEALRFGLTDVKSVGAAACKAILAARPFESWEDFENRVPARSCNKTVKAALVSVDAFYSVEGAPRHPYPEENYLEYLSYPILLEKVSDIGLPTISIEKFNILNDEVKGTFGIVCAVVKSTKRTDTYFRIELEDLTSNLTVFGSMDCDLSSGDTVIALVGDNTLVGYTNADGLKEREGLGTLNDFEKWLLYEPLEDYKLLTKFGMGLVWEPKSLLIPLQVRVVTTKRGQQMCFAYLSDRERNVVKVTIFPAVWEKICSDIETELHAFRPVCAQLSRLDDGGLTIWSNGIIDAELKLKEKETILK